MTVSEAWEHEAENWARFARTPGHDHYYERLNLPHFLEILPPPGRRTLDLACGEGRLTRELARRGYPIVAVDSSPSMVRLAREHPDAPEVIVADARHLPFADREFDLVVAFMALHDLDDLPAAVSEAARVLTRGGAFCIAIHHPFQTAGAFETSDADAAFVVADSYLDPRRVQFVSDRNGIRMTFNQVHRPIAAYAEAIEDAGLVIEVIREPAPSDKDVSLDASAERWRRIPLFLHLRARRDGDYRTGRCAAAGSRLGSGLGPWTTDRRSRLSSSCAPASPRLGE